MTAPTADQLREFFKSDESVYDWVVEQLEDKAALECTRWDSSRLVNIDMSRGMAEAEIMEEYSCGCCSDEYHGEVELSLDEMLSLVEDPEEQKRALAALAVRAAEEAKAKAEYAAKREAERKAAQEKTERETLARLQEKYK